MPKFKHYWDEHDLSVANDSMTVKGCTLILDEAKVVYQEQNIQLSLTELQILKLLFQMKINM